MLSEAASRSTRTEIGDSTPGKNNLKRAADVVDSCVEAIKRPKLTLNAPVNSLKGKVSPAASNSPASTSLVSKSSASSPITSGPDIHLDLRRGLAQTSSSTSSGGVASSKKVVTRSPNPRTPQRATPEEAPFAGASGHIKGDMRRGSSSVASETQNGPPQQLATNSAVKTKPRARLPKHGQGKSTPVGEATGSKQQAEFRNFNPSDVPTKGQPSGSLARPTAAQAASLPPSFASTEARSSFSRRSTLLSLFRGR
jgi:hypothetical protein